MDSIIYGYKTSLQGRIEFRSGDHVQPLWGVHRDIWRQKTQNIGEALMAMTEGFPPIDTHSLCQGQKTGACLSVAPFTINGMEIGSQKLRDVIFL